MTLLAICVPEQQHVRHQMPFERAVFQDWIGRSSASTEEITPSVIARFSATLGGLIEERPVPLGLFWTLGQHICEAANLGADGHARAGVILPALPLPRRMWAGGELRLHGDFAPGDCVTRTGAIEDITSKSGASGPLGFVTLRNRYEVGSGVVLEERQDIVYRDDPDPRVKIGPRPPAKDLPAVRAAFAFNPDPVLLFRFSAITFNAHRIHYDRPYATEVEAYDGLVVHGPLQAILMLNLAARVFGHLPARFTYRAIAPLICGSKVFVEAYEGETSELSLRVRVDGGPVTMSAQAS
jgi:3-methylfumaryl-CoA hydratase